MRSQDLAGLVASERKDLKSHLLASQMALFEVLKFCAFAVLCMAKVIRILRWTCLLDDKGVILFETSFAAGRPSSVRAKAGATGDLTRRQLSEYHPLRLSCQMSFRF
jgi:hypothetical protein